MMAEGRSATSAAGGCHDDALRIDGGEGQDGMARLRVASLQYFIRPIQAFDQFRDQVIGLVETAADYGSRLVVFPEYFSLQLLTLGDVKRRLPEQIRSLAAQEPAFIALMGRLATEHDLYIVAGTIPHVSEEGVLTNVCHVFGPDGRHGLQAKLHMTRFEREWGTVAGAGLSVFETSFGRLAVAICYDVEFPELVRAAARLGAHVLAVPSCTDDRQGFLRVRYCAQARAIENQMYVIQASTVGSLPMVPAVSLNYGQAGIFTPSDFAFARDGVLAEGIPNQETMVIAELNLDTILEARESGTVQPLLDSGPTQTLVASPVVVTL
jgi:predicted amidohydrolase